MMLILACSDGALESSSASGDDASATADGTVGDASTVDTALFQTDGEAPDPPDGRVADDDAGGPDDVAAVPPDAAAPRCPGEGPAYLHGDLWAFWFAFRTACDRQHRWWWICEQRLPGQCDTERAWFEDCWQARGAFPRSGWDGSTPSPHSPNYGVCQPHHWPEKNDAARRPGNATPCDTTTFDYDVLRTADPFYGVDWWAGKTGTRHLTVKLFEQGTDPFASQGKADGIANLSTHPGNRDALMEDLGNHGFPGARGGCIHAPDGDPEAPGLSQSFGAFAWLEVPVGRPVHVAANWNGLLQGDISLECVRGLDFFPESFGAHAVAGKPWFTLSPCFDLERSVVFEAGRHYLWDVHGLHVLEGCDGPPESVLAAIPAAKRDGFRSGACDAP